jgi:ADP-ribose pyrophosphatase
LTPPSERDPDNGPTSRLEDVTEEWPVHDVEDVWSGPAPFSVRNDTISPPDRPEQTFSRLVLQHPGAAVILALDDEERVLVVHQYRHPVGQRLVELPAGLLDVEGEDPLETAVRELREEGLVIADRWTHLLSTYSSPGLTSEKIHHYLARGLHPAADRGDFEPEHEEADMTTSWVPIHDLLDGLLGGRISDGPLGQAVMAYLLLRDRGEV